jgi:exodeoxyribonuclease V alpha subunit
MMSQPPAGFMDNVVNEETLSSEQKNAVYGALSNNVSILTGGPGCGKTYTTKTIVDSLINAKKSVGICAPTGKAALRSSFVIGREAMTIHRLLGFNPKFKGNFQYNADNPLQYDFVIVEESSMVDIKLMSHLLDAIGYGTQVLFVGDHNQLPPVGAGAPFKDMIESGLIPTFKLNKIFRQGDNSSTTVNIRT